MLNVLVINAFQEGDLKMFTDVRVDVEVVMDAIQDVHVQLEVEDLDVADDLDKGEDVTADGKVPFATCEAHVNVDVKVRVRTQDALNEGARGDVGTPLGKVPVDCDTVLHSLDHDVQDVEFELDIVSHDVT